METIEATATTADFPYTATNRMDVSAGGLMVGPGTETSDDIPVIVQAGTFVLNAEAVRLVGADQLEEICRLAMQARVKAWFSTGEFVIPSVVTAVIGRPLLDAINAVGNDVRNEFIPAECEAVALVCATVQRVIDKLTTGDILNVDLAGEYLDGAGGEPQMAVGNFVGIALGSAVNELNRQRDQERRDKVLQLEQDSQAMQRERQAQVLKLGTLDINKEQARADDDRSVRDHIANWRDGLKKIQAGDFSPIESEITDYNSQLPHYDNGHTLVPQNTPEGPVLNHTDPQGNIVETIKPTDAVALYNLGMSQKLKFLSPARYDEFEKNARAVWEKHQDRMDQDRRAQMAADSQRYGADVRAGATVDAAKIHAGATRDAAGMRGGLTLTQQRSNEEIQAAREAVDGLSDDDIRVRTTPTTASGRTNDQFDPALARQARLAGRRKVGDDPEFGQKKVRPIDAATAAFSADPAFQGKGYALGKQTTRGFEVKDSAGKLLGYYGAKQ